MRSTNILFILALSTAAFLACGGGETKPPETPSGGGDAGMTMPEPAADAGGATSTTPPAAHEDAGAAATTPPTPEKSGFDAMTKDQKVDVMTTKVVPNVGKLFKEHDGKKFAKVNCATCHGAKKEAPQKVLPKLKLSGDGFEKLSKAKPKVMKFMSEKVVPAMAEALGEKPYDPATKQGFGCAGCHTVE